MTRSITFSWLLLATLFSATLDAVALAAGDGATNKPLVSAVKDWREQLSRPDPEFAQMPFWFWNDELDNREIARQMAEFRRHGVYGFVIHGRMGLPTSIPYMGRRWLDHVRFAVEEAARTGMRVCLYDEGMYPSGSAHGAVVRSNPAFASQGLSVQSKDLTGPATIEIPPPGYGTHVASILAKRRDAQDTLELGAGQITLRPGPAGTARQLSTVQVPEGRWRLMTFVAAPSGGHIRGVHPGEEDGQPGAPAAADLLNPAAMKAFLRFAYEPYCDALQAHFGRTVVAMFTDEPSLLGRGARRGQQPWTSGLAEDFQRRRGYSLVEWLPALFYDVGEKTRRIREDFQLTLAERLDETYYQQLSRWCQSHGIALTGHPSGSDEIRPLRHFQLPGQDMVWRWVLPSKPSALEGPDSTVAKCSASAACHDSRRRNGNEIYGAYGWHLTMDEMKWLADWLAVRGVNLLYPHAFYYSVRDRRAYERPPDLGLHNAWWPHYRLFADYTSRLCKLMTDGRPVCDVAVLSVNNRLPTRAAKWLYQNQVDFFYLEDWRLAEQASIADGKLCVGPMTYRLLIVDEDQPLPAATDARVREFQRQGGLVRVCRASPTDELVTGLTRDVALDSAGPDLRYTHVVKRPSQESRRPFAGKGPGVRAEIAETATKGIHLYLFVNEGEQEIESKVTCRCRGRAEWFDPWTAQFSPATVLHAGSTMQVALRLPRRASLILAIDPSQPVQVATAHEPKTSAKQTSATPILGPWRIVDLKGKPVGDRLGDWREHPGLNRFAGTLRYQTTFAVSKQPGARYRLDLGTVGDWAVVRLNSKDLGPRLWAPLEWDVTEALKDGTNELVVDVTNSRANQYDPKNARPSGLFGPVELRH